MQLVFATNNGNKIKEVQRLIPQHIKLLSLQDIGCFEDIPETQKTLKGNAIQKANYIKDNFGYDCFADDTGLEVEALDSAPGVYSARYAGEQRDANDNMDKLLNELENQQNRAAQFKTVIALHLNDQLQTFTEICKGNITLSKQGEQGFGYDPIFKPIGYTKTFAELSIDEKNTRGSLSKISGKTTGTQKAIIIIPVHNINRQYEQESCVKAVRATMFQISPKPLPGRMLRMDRDNPNQVPKPADFTRFARAQSSMIAFRMAPTPPTASRALDSINRHPPAAAAVFRPG